jgi:hypothetical protein
MSFQSLAAEKKPAEVVEQPEPATPEKPAASEYKSWEGRYVES